jgi:hypothetical protein
MLGGRSAHASPPTESPEAAVRRTLDEASALTATDLNPDQKVEALRPVAGELIDTRAMGRQDWPAALRSLGG